MITMTNRLSTYDLMKVLLGLIAEARRNFGTKVAAQLWLELGLPTVPGMYRKPPQGELF
jgi:hypothetical protein